MSKRRGFKIHIPDEPNVPESPCPHCGALHTCATSMGERYLPVPGKSFGMCIECGEVNGYDENLQLVKLDAMQLLECELDPEAGPIMKAAREAWALLKFEEAMKKRGVAVVCIGRIQP